MVMDKKEEILKYLFPTEEIRKFLVNDLYQELLKNIDTTLFYNDGNIFDGVRYERYKKVYNDIELFLYKNREYAVELARLFDGHDFVMIIEDLICGIVFYYINVIKKELIDIFSDRRSLVYLCLPF